MFFFVVRKPTDTLADRSARDRDFSGSAPAKLIRVGAVEDPPDPTERIYSLNGFLLVEAESAPEACETVAAIESGVGSGAEYFALEAPGAITVALVAKGA